MIGLFVGSIISGPAADRSDTLLQQVSHGFICSIPFIMTRSRLEWYFFQLNCSFQPNCLYSYCDRALSILFWSFFFRYGRRIVCLISLFGNAVLLVGYSFAQSFECLIVLTSVLGIDQMILYSSAFVLGKFHLHV